MSSAVFRQLSRIYRESVFFDAHAASEIFCFSATDIFIDIVVMSMYIVYMVM